MKHAAIANQQNNVQVTKVYMRDSMTELSYCQLHLWNQTITLKQSYHSFILCHTNLLIEHDLTTLWQNICPNGLAYWLSWLFLPCNYHFYSQLFSFWSSTLLIALDGCEGCSSPWVCTHVGDLHKAPGWGLRFG